MVTINQIKAFDFKIDEPKLTVIPERKRRRRMNGDFTTDIKQALENINVSTARGRRVLDKREIDITPCDAQVANNASCRADGYIDVAKKLRAVVEHDPVGIPEGELESVEFIMEQLEGLARRAQELYIRTY